MEIVLCSCFSYVNTSMTINIIANSMVRFLQKTKYVKLTVKIKITEQPQAELRNKWKYLYRKLLRNCCELFYIHYSFLFTYCCVIKRKYLLINPLHIS